MREARGLLVAPPISFDTRVYPAEKYSCCAVIYAATIMLKPVADNQIIHFQHHVVAGNLVENLWVISISGAFVFHNHPGGKVAPIEHCITAFLCTVQLYLHPFAMRACGYLL